MCNIMNLVIDIQGLKDKYNNFIPKEVAIVSIQTAYVGHWIVKSPYVDCELSSIIKRQNSWLERSHHGIPWTEGDISLRAMEIILKKIAGHADRIFTRGSEKASYLSHLTGCFVINLEEDEEVPPFRNLPDEGIRCVHHRLLLNKEEKEEKRLQYKCSLDYASRLKTWLGHSERIDSLWQYRTTAAWNIGLSDCPEKETKATTTLSTSAVGYEQPGNSAHSSGYKRPYSGRIPSRSYPEGVDETDSYCR